MRDPLTRRKLPTVLLIDDDLVTREVAATVLTMSGYNVHTAESGEASLAMIAAGACLPDVILVDAQMPGLSGVPLIEELRRRAAAVVIAISGSRPPEQIAAAADGFLLKPFDAAKLEDLLEKRKPEATAPPAGDPVISAQTLAQLRSLMPESAIREIYTALLADLDKRFKAIEEAIAAGDAAEVGRIGHAIKGGCAMAGALETARLGAQLEALPLEPKSNHLDNSTRLLGDLRAAARNLERMLEAELPS